MIENIGNKHRSQANIQVMSVLHLSVEYTHTSNVLAEELYLHGAERPSCGFGCTVLCRTVGGTLYKECWDGDTLCYMVQVLGDSFVYIVMETQNNPPSRNGSLTVTTVCLGMAVHNCNQ